MITNRKRVAKRLASGLVAGALALGGLAISGGSASAQTPAQATTNRFGGSDRYSTSIILADVYADSVGLTDVIVVSGENWADGLTAAGLAGAKSAPIIQVKGDSLPSNVRDWFLINRGDISGNTVWVVGGEAAVSASVVDAIEAAIDDSTVTIERLAGDDRYETAVAVATEIGGGDIDLVSGENFADALAVGPSAYTNGEVILLTRSSGLPAAVSAYIGSDAVVSAAPSIYIVGGPAAIARSVEDDIVNLGHTYGAIERTYGADRYATAAAINEDWYSGSTDYFVVSGSNFADALSAAPVIGDLGGGILMVPGSTAGASALESATALGTAGNFSDLWIVGGTSAVSAAAVNDIVAASQSTNVASAMTCVDNNGTYDAVISGLGSDAVAAAVAAGNVLVNGIGGVATVSVLAVADAADKVLVDANSPASGTVISFSGIPETAGVATFSVAGSSCTWSADTTAPTVASVAGSVGSSTLLVTFSEAVLHAGTGAAATANQLDDTDVTLYDASATADVACTLATVDGAAIAAAGSGAAYGVSCASPVAAGDYLKVSITGAIKDASYAANGMAAAYTGTAFAADATAPSIAASSLECASDTTPANQPIWSFGQFNAIALVGATANSWKMAVVNQRGLIYPTVAIDAAAKTATITVEVAYWSGTELAAYLNLKELGGSLFTFSATGATITAAAAAYPTAGDYDCELTIAWSEGVDTGNTSIDSVTVGGVPISFSDTVTAAGASVTWDETDVALVPGSVVVGVTVTDNAGNASVTSVTVSGTLDGV